MRQIKFRGWDKKYKRMIEPSRNFLIETYDGLPVWQFGFDEPKPMEQNEIELMQYTGLLDKNGKEIYEGDIVKNEFFSLEKVEYRNDFDGDDRGTFYWSGFCLSGNPDNWEIIGNIYEDSHLLEGK